MTNLVIMWRNIQLGKHRVFKDNVCLIHKIHHKAHGGDARCSLIEMEELTAPWLSLSPILTELSPIDPTLCTGITRKISVSNLRPAAQLSVVAVAYLELYYSQDTVTLNRIEGSVILNLMGALPAPSPPSCVGRDPAN